MDIIYETDIKQFVDASKPYSTNMTGVRLDNNNKTPLLRFSCMDAFDWLSFGFTTKLGGVSQGHLESLNLGWKQGDKRENVCENYRRACASLPGEPDKLVFSDQIHEDRVEYVTEKDCAGSSFNKMMSGVDGMITDVPGIILATSYADCVPLFFVDSVNHCIGSSHSGWRGTVKRIGEKTIKNMEKKFGSKPENMVCLIGPSICQKCYEVSVDVIEKFKDSYSQECLCDIFVADESKHGKYKLDLWAAIWHQLIEAGMKKENIYVSGICTNCNYKLLFSHRKTNGKRGAMNGLIKIN